MARIKISRRFEEQLGLGEKIYGYHESLGDKSPLNGHIDMNNFGKTNVEAKKHNNEKDRLEKLSENERELRDNMWDGNMNDIRRIAQFLKAINKDNPHELGKWGFEVNETAHAKVES